MGKQQKQLRLGAFLPGAGQHVAAWRHPQARSNGALNFEHYKQIAQTAERGKFDAFFLADGLALQQRRGAEGRTANLQLHHTKIKIYERKTSVSIRCIYSSYWSSYFCLATPQYTNRCRFEF
jgi:alkanesulfonate monooxygenase SsuD/methylene tetrahydromethanopterin reductase-like flavin-dependent oxidoreductase (luciferase family)